MLPHYSPFKVAETFSVLAGLFPGRIDLGIGRAAGTDPMTTFALQRDRRQPAPDDFPQQLAELLAYFEDDFPPDHPFARLGRPARRRRSSRRCGCSAPRRRARSGPRELGLPYSFADFINPAARRSRGAYRERFEPSRAARDAARRGRACGRSAPTPTRRRSGSPPAAAWR